MAEYYPLLAKAVGSLPNSSPETRRIVYERARKALIGQLRTMHPPIPDEDIERESVELDRAIERVETELAAAPVADPGAAAPAAPPAAPPLVQPPVAPPKPSGTLGPSARKPIAPLRPPVPRPARPPALPAEAAKAADPVASDPVPADPLPAGAEAPAVGAAETAVDPTPARDLIPAKGPMPREDLPAFAPVDADASRPRLETQRPIAPMPPTAKGPKRPIWILPVGILLVVLAVGAAAWKLRVRPETMARNVPVVTQAQQSDNGKIADRVGGAPAPDETANTPTANTPAETPAPSAAPAPDTAPPATEQPAAPTETAKQETAPPPINPAVPVAYRAALLVEAPDTPAKVQTFPGTVVWKLNNVNAGPSDAVGLSVEASIDLPQDKTRATVVFERNTDASLPASHTIKVRFIIDPGSYSGDIKQISVPQMRREGNSDGEPLAGVTVPVVQNSFLVGLSPGNAETANLRLINDLPWVDIPILLGNGKIAKLTFEKGAAGQRDIAEALAYWQKP